MRLLGILLMALMCIPAMSSADSTIVGSYNVSFDLGLSKASYNVSVNNSTDKDYFGGTYSIGINQKKNNLKTTKILINDDGSMPSADILSLLDKQNIKTSEIVIDGINSTLTTGDISLLGFKIPYYEASYYPFEDTGVLIISLLPEKGTKFLNTIHVKKINTTS